MSGLIDALGDPDTSIREKRAAYSLRRIGDPRAAPRLIEMLGDREDRLRNAAASALVDLDLTEHADAAVTGFIGVLEDRVMRNYDNRGIVQNAVVALGRLRDPRAVPVLLEALSSYHKHVPLEAAAALGKIGDPKAVPHLARTLRYRSGRSSSRSAMAAALGEIGDPSAVTHLLDTLNQERDSAVRAESATALGRLGDVSVIPHQLAALG
ncbi:MAG: HEAT repeat domain-containing protein, partial [Gammaproteobacteria bacterium]|nr:HEAT repeat domain-containing protein [Gammaproteobacteria bacterium]